jgi:hypothetical protein
LRLAGLALVALSAGPAGAWATAGPSVSQLNDTRLVGRFSMAGRVTDAAGVRGERRGDRVTRTWRFSDPCASTPCHTATLTRRRSGGTDKLTLRRRSPAAYAGSGTFVLPLTCGRRRYASGELVRFSITVTVTQVRATGFGLLAGAVQASYVSRSRQNLTPCVLAPAHDAARYTGVLG